MNGFFVKTDGKEDYFTRDSIRQLQHVVSVSCLTEGGWIEALEDAQDEIVKTIRSLKKEFREMKNVMCPHCYTIPNMDYLIDNCQTEHDHGLKCPVCGRTYHWSAWEAFFIRASGDISRSDTLETALKKINIFMRYIRHISDKALGALNAD